MRRSISSRPISSPRAVAIASCTLLLLAAVVTPRRVHAQALDAAAPTVPADGPVCLGFSFGAWTPKLDWRAVGHTTPAPGSAGVKGAAAASSRAPGGRDWAASLGGDDDAILLFPRFWPAGVTVDLPTRTPAVGDTVTGRAMALVPRGDVAPPVAQVKAWRVACRRPTPPPTTTTPTEPSSGSR